MRRRVGADLGLRARMLLTMLLLAVLYAAFVWVLLWLRVDLLLVLGLVAILIVVQYAFSDQLVMASIGAREVSEAEAPRLHDIVTRLAQTTDLPKPRVAIVDSPVPNALATGRNPRHSVVAVTTGLLDRLTPEEVEAVLAHELSHVIHRDVKVMTMATVFSTLASFLVQFGVWGGLGGRGRDRDRGGSGAIVLLVAAAVWLISFVLIRTLSRYREYEADRGSALITGRPSLLASALLKIADRTSRIPERDLRQVEGASALMIFPLGARGSLAELLSTHPSLEHRLERLQRMEAEMGRG
ncbi:MAG TPA: zinc metalloprotease HtpX [Candidatus Dormibacteraeota bacterium]|jgi:heat shock protein HtpX|nr:zinc metalloprotease HtpX [Candidatus Dormibacteraeota bacterium]